jgi:hypothetical protein
MGPVMCLRIGIVVVIAIVLTGSAAAAESSARTTTAPPTTAAAENSPVVAKNAANQFVDVMLQHSAGEKPWCDTRPRQGFIDRRAFYLASCANHDGAFQFFSVVSATSGSRKTSSAYYQQQLAHFCAGGHAFAFGVQGRFANTYAGTGPGVETANGLIGTAAEAYQALQGYVAPIKLC